MLRVWQARGKDALYQCIMKNVTSPSPSRGGDVQSEDESNA